MSIVGDEWKKKSAEDKKHYIDMAERLRQDHMKQYPDYKYRPRRRKGIKKADNNTSQNNGNGLQKPPRENGLQRSNSFSYGDFPFGHCGSDTERLSRSVPVSSRMLSTPESNTSSPEPYQQDLHRSRLPHFGFDFHPKAFHNQNNSLNYLSDISLSQIPEPVNFTPPQEVPFACRIEESHVHRNEMRYPHVPASYYKHSSTDAELQASIIDDLKELDSAEFEQYINPQDEKSTDMKIADVNANLIKNKMFNSCRQDLNTTTISTVGSTYPEQKLFWGQTGQNGLCHSVHISEDLVPETAKDINIKYKDINDVCYEYDAQPMINALTK